MFGWPIHPARVSSGFGRRDGAMHNGIDIAANPGTPIMASAPGRVVYSGNGLRGYGNLIIIEHKDDFRTIYAHNQANKVPFGAEVRKGQVVALVGQTGRATAPHLHFEIRLKTRALNPLDYLP